MIDPAPLFLKVCWLKAVCGAWCTTSRMSSICRWQCIFGCADSRDEFIHYLCCPALWQFARETLRIQEDSVMSESRLCLVSPTRSKLRLLAFVHTLYHTLKNDPRCVKPNGMPVNSNLMQRTATEVCRSIKFSIPGGE